MYKSVTLQCSAININKTLSSLTYQWQKNTNDIKGACSNIYQTNEPGVYRCKISNKYTTVYTQDAILTLEPVWVTDIIINTQSITNSGKIQYTINPENATNKTITFDTKITPEYSIDSSGNVIINVDNCNFEVVARSQFGKDYSEVVGKGIVTGYVNIPLQSIQITTTTIQDAGQIETMITPVNASIIKKEFELLSGSQYVVMNDAGYISEVKSPGTISVRVSGFDKSGNVITDEKYITLKNKYTKVTNVEITTETIHNNGYIQYETTPPSTLSDLKSVKIELYNEGNSEYIEVDINENGEVTNITEDKDGKKFKAKITVIDKYNNVIINTKEITCKYAISVESIIVPIQEITDEGFITYTILPENATNKNVIFEFTTPPPDTTQTIGDADIDNITGKITVINEGFNYVAVIAQDGSGVKGEGTIILKKTPIIIPVQSITVPSQTITDEGIIDYTIIPSNATNKNVKFNFKSPTSNATIDSSTGKITVVNDDTVVVVVSAQDGSNVSGEGQITLKKTVVNPTITITPDSLTDSGTVAYTITPETSCQFAIINGTFDAVTIDTTGNVDTDNNIMWFVGAKTIDIASVKYDSNLVVRVSCMDGSGYYVDKTIPVKSTKIQSLTIDLPDGGFTIADFNTQYADYRNDVPQHTTYTIPITVTPNNLNQYIKFNTMSFTYNIQLTTTIINITHRSTYHYKYVLNENGELTIDLWRTDGHQTDANYINILTDDIKVTAYTTDGSNLSITSTLFKKDT